MSRNEIEKIVEIPITDSSYPFASAEKYCQISKNGYVEQEYFIHGKANVYQTGTVGLEVLHKGVSYINRFLLRKPENIADFSGNVVIEILNPTTLRDLDRVWVLGKDEFMRSGDIYLGITSKPSVLKSLVAFDKERYESLSWPNPTPEKPFPFTKEEVAASGTAVADQDTAFETGLFWDMVSDLARVLRSDSELNILREYQPKSLVLSGWSQSGCYLLKYINDFAYLTDEIVPLFDGYLAAGPARSFAIPVNQYETLSVQSESPLRVTRVQQPLIIMQTESENGLMDGAKVVRRDSDDLDFLCREYDVTGSSHETIYTSVDYYGEAEDLRKINKQPSYSGKEPLPNSYPIELLFHAGFRNLFRWIREGVAPARCELVALDSNGENRKDALGNSIGGLRTCLLNYPTRAYYNASSINKGDSGVFPDATRNILFGYEEAFPKVMLEQMYKTLANYVELITKDTLEQVSKGFILKEDANNLIALATKQAQALGLN